MTIATSILLAAIAVSTAATLADVALRMASAFNALSREMYP